MAKTRIFVGVLRISDVRLAQADLEAALGVESDRYEPSRTSSAHYAQIDIPVEKGMPEDDVWSAVVECVQKIGPKISALKSDRLIGATCCDLAVAFGNTYTISIGVPSYAAEAIGRHGIDIELSIYPTADDAGHDA